MAQLLMQQQQLVTLLTTSGAPVQTSGADGGTGTMAAKRHPRTKLPPLGSPKHTSKNDSVHVQAQQPVSTP